MVDFKKAFDTYRLGDIYYKNIHLGSVMDHPDKDEKIDAVTKGLALL